MFDLFNSVQVSLLLYQSWLVGCLKLSAPNSNTSYEAKIENYCFVYKENFWQQNVNFDNLLLIGQKDLKIMTKVYNLISSFMSKLFTILLMI